MKIGEPGDGPAGWSAKFVVLAALLGLPSYAVAQGLPFATYTTDDGLAQGIVMALGQGRGGFLWAGTPDGLSRFDGLTFETYSLADGLPNAVVRAVYEAADGTLWIGTDDGVAHRGPEASVFTPIRELAGSPLGSVRALAQTPDGTIWIGTYDVGLIRMGPDGSTSHIGREQGLPGDRVRALQVDRQGRLWAGTYGAGIALVAEDAIITFGAPEGLDDPFVRALALDPVGRLLAGTNGGLFRHTGDRFELILDSEALGGTEISAVAVDATGRLWVGTRDRGACHLDEHRPLTCLGIDDGLPENGINAILADREGSLWFGTFGGGLARLAAEGFEIWTERHGLPYASVAAFAEGPAGVMWIGTHGGGVSRIDADAVEVFDTRNGLPHNKVVSELWTSRGNLWIGTLDGAARRDEEGRLRIIDAGRLLPSEVVLSLAEDHLGRVWLATTAGIAIVTDEDRPKLVGSIAAELPSPRVNCLQRAGKAMWIGSGAGLARWTETELDSWEIADGLPDGYVQTMQTAPDGALWVGTAKGLARFQYGAFRVWTTADGLAHDKVQALAEDAAGRLWIGTTRGISVLDGSEIRSFTTRDGLVSGEVNQEAAFLDSQGRVWMGTVLGAIAFLPEARSPPVKPPIVHLTSIAVGDRQLPLAGPIELEAAENDLTFSFVGVSLAHPDEVTYEVQLAGLDERPRTVANRSVLYAAIPPGRYQFRVTARVRGVPSEDIASIRIEIAPPLWATWWFRAMVGIGVLSLAWIAHRSRLATMGRRNSELQVLLSEREQAEAAVRKYAGELEHKSLHDTLTDLPNRALLLDRVAVALETSRESRGRTCAVICLDLDDFKLINDSRGHHAGDTLLLEIAGRLAAAARPGDTVASLGGDDFVVLLAQVHGAVEATRIGQDLQAVVAEPLAVGDQEIVMSASLGIAVDGGRYRRPEDLLRDADTALYRAKARGRAQCAIFDTVMHESTVQQLQLSTDLRRAVERAELRLLYQPIRRLSDGRTVHLEALLRWQHPTRGLLLPGDFLGSLHDVGLTEVAGEWVLREACRQAAEWARRFDPAPRIAINLFSSQVMQLDLADRIQHILGEVGLDARHIGLEVTENVLIEDPTTAIIALAQARTQRIEISLDDFGTGYSSLSYLERFPVDVLKIDRSFVSRLDGTNDSSPIVESILRLARSLGLQVVAEGVESELQLQRLRELGCDHVQGYHIARPLTAVEAQALLDAEHAAVAAAAS